MGPVPKCLQQSDKAQFLHLFKTDIKPSHIERAVKFVSSNSTKLKSETSPIVSSFRETGDKGTISEHQKSNKEDMLQKFPPKNILQKRFYSTDRDDGRLN